MGERVPVCMVDEEVNERNMMSILDGPPIKENLQEIVRDLLLRCRLRGGPRLDSDEGRSREARPDPRLLRA